MKQYPSIQRSTGVAFREFDAHVFDKLDGSNLRFEWQRKNGKKSGTWLKYGTRARLFDASDPIFAPAIPLFHSNLADVLEQTAIYKGWERITAYAEFWGPKSFAGKHEPGDEFRLTLFDVEAFKRGFVPPKEFVKLFSKVDSARYLGTHRWDQDFIQRVRLGEMDGVTFEGVVGKESDPFDPYRAKAKTEAWLDAVRKSHTAEEAARLIDS